MLDPGLIPPAPVPIETPLAPPPAPLPTATLDPAALPEVKAPFPIATELTAGVLALFPIATELVAPIEPDPIATEFGP